MTNCLIHMCRYYYILSVSPRMADLYSKLHSSIGACKTEGYSVYRMAYMCEIQLKMDDYCTNSFIMLLSCLWFICWTLIWQKDDDDSVFTTQVDEETLDAAKERQQKQNNYIEVERPASRQNTLTMKDVVLGKAEEQYVLFYSTQ